MQANPPAGLGLIQLCSRQIVPNLLLGLALQRSGWLHRHVLLHTDHATESVGPARHILSVLQDDPLRGSAACLDPLMWEVEATARHTCLIARAVMDEHPGVRWLLHATGGNKLMSAGLQALARDVRVHAVVYRDIDGEWLQVRFDSDGTPDNRCLGLHDEIGALVHDPRHALDTLPVGVLLRAQHAAEVSVDNFDDRHDVGDIVDLHSWLAAAFKPGGSLMLSAPRRLRDLIRSEGTAMECFLAHALRAAGVHRVAWGVTGAVGGNKVIELDGVACHGNRLAFYDVKIERSDAAGKTEQIRMAHDTARQLGGLSAAAVMVRPNWPATAHVLDFARALGVHLIHRGNLGDLLRIACKPLGIGPERLGHLASLGRRLEERARGPQPQVFRHGATAPCRAPV